MLSQELMQLKQSEAIRNAYGDSDRLHQEHQDRSSCMPTCPFKRRFLLALRPVLAVLAVAAASGLQNISAQSIALDTIGLNLLRVEATNVDGSGIRVGQIEAEMATNPPTFEVMPGGAGRPASTFTYFSSLGSASTYPNSVGAASSHAQAVAGYFYSTSGGIATNVAHVDNHDANEFVHAVRTPVGFSAVLPATNINDGVVNESFVFFGLSASEQQVMDSTYDNYAARYATLFVSAVGNGGSVLPPGTCYNGIGVGAYGSGSASSVGPTLDNGRAKPDITAPESFTSFSTPQVSGAAAVLMQAALRGDGGPATASASDIRTVKALLINGAVKPQDWASHPPSPLDPRYGSGVLNVFNAYEQLVGLQHGFIVSTKPASGGPHPPTSDPATVGAPRGWDFNTVSSTSAVLLNPAMDGVNHYYFNLTNRLAGEPLTATLTLVWSRQANQTAINNLSLFLIDRATGNLVAASTSIVDNVQHVFVERLPAGQYDVQVLKSASNSVSDAETYALAFDFSSTMLVTTRAGAGLMLTWPVYPAGLAVESSTTLSSSVGWTRNPDAPVISNHLNQVMIDATNAAQYFRLKRP
jgi:subtilase family protein